MSAPTAVTGWSVAMAADLRANPASRLHDQVVLCHLLQRVVIESRGAAAEAATSNEIGSNMTQTPTYSTLFSCLHDETEPIGSLGRGTHYSVFRCVEWLDVVRRPLAVPQVHDFAVIWDEDHDTRVIEAVEQIYMAGLLSPVQFIGERKGMLTVIVAARFYFSGTVADTDAYRESINAISRDLDDSWPADLGSFDRSPGSPHQCFYEGIIADSDHRVGLYLANIDSLWSLGTREYRPPAPLVPWDNVPPPPPIPVGQLPPPPPFVAATPKPFPPGGILPPVTSR